MIFRNRPPGGTGSCDPPPGGRHYYWIALPGLIGLIGILYAALHMPARDHLLALHHNSRLARPYPYAGAKGTAIRPQDRVQDRLFPGLYGDTDLGRSNVLEGSKKMRKRNTWRLFFSGNVTTNPGGPSPMYLTGRAFGSVGSTNFFQNWLWLLTDVTVGQKSMLAGLKNIYDIETMAFQPDGGSYNGSAHFHTGTAQNGSLIISGLAQFTPTLFNSKPWLMLNTPTFPTSLGYCIVNRKRVFTRGAIPFPAPTYTTLPVYPGPQTVNVSGVISDGTYQYQPLPTLQTVGTGTTYSFQGSVPGTGYYYEVASLAPQAPVGGPYGWYGGTGNGYILNLFRNGVLSGEPIYQSSADPAGYLPLTYQPAGTLDQPPAGMSGTITITPTNANSLSNVAYLMQY